MNNGAMCMNLCEDKTAAGETMSSKRAMEKRKRSEIGSAISSGYSRPRSDGQSPACPMQEDVHQRPLLCGIEPSIEPLKVCLDDDSSIEDDDEDMFDDDAFTFGDEDFEALMSHESMQRSTRRSTTHASAALGCPNSLHSPLHESATIVNDHLVFSSATALSSSTALSSTASLGNLTSASSHASCNSSLSKKSRSKRKVSLHNDVSVMPIPMRTEYTNLVKERLWSSSNDLYQNAVRNSIEFASEGWNWRTVADDDQMIRSPSGERIHPIHFVNTPAVVKEKKEVGCEDDLMDSEPVTV